LLVASTFQFLASVILFPGIVGIMELSATTRMGRNGIETVAKTYDGFNHVEIGTGTLTPDPTWTATERAAWVFDTDRASAAWSSALLRIGSPSITGSFGIVQEDTGFEDNGDPSSTANRAKFYVAAGTAGYNLYQGGTFVASKTNAVQLGDSDYSLVDTSLVVDLKVQQTSAQYQSGLYANGLYRLEAFVSFFIFQFIVGFALFIIVATDSSSVGASSGDNKVEVKTRRAAVVCGWLGFLFYFFAYVLAMDGNSLITVSTWFQSTYGIGAWWNATGNSIFLSILIICWLLVILCGHRMKA
jgi:hypothetical protein